MGFRKIAVGLAGLIAATLTTGCDTPDPVGAVDWVRGGIDTLTIAGWAVDPDGAEAPMTVHVYVDGTLVGAGQTTVARPDVAALYPGHGSMLGYHLTFPAGAGSHRVCAYAINVNEGTVNPEIGCRTVTVLSHDPFGTVDAFERDSVLMVVRGWAFDPDGGPIDYSLLVDGAEVLRLPATIERPDVAALYPSAGTVSGFEFELFSAWTPTQQACVVAHNIDAGTDREIGCAGAGSGRSFSDDGPVGQGHWPDLMLSYMDPSVVPFVGLRVVTNVFPRGQFPFGPFEPNYYWLTFQRIDGSWVETEPAWVAAPGGIERVFIDVPLPPDTYHVCVIGGGVSQTGLGARELPVTQACMNSTVTDPA